MRMLLYLHDGHATGLYMDSMKFRASKRRHIAEPGDRFIVASLLYRRAALTRLRISARHLGSAHRGSGRHRIAYEGLSPRRMADVEMKMTYYDAILNKSFR